MLALKILTDAQWARLWGLVQRDPHLSAYEMIAIVRNQTPETELDSFARTRAKRHLAHCGQCQPLHRMFESVARAPAAMADFARRCSAILTAGGAIAGAAPQTTRSTDRPRLAATIVGKDEVPKLDEGGVPRTQDVTLSQASIVDGRLTIELQSIPPAYDAARVIVQTSSDIAVSDWLDVSNGTASIDIPIGQDVDDVPNGRILQPESLSLGLRLSE